MPTIHITLLGRFAVTVDGVPVADSNWTRRHAAALVKVLAMAPGPAPAPRADHRSRVARRHDRRGGAQAAQGGALRPAGHRRAQLGGAARRQRRPVSRRRRRSSTSCRSRSSPVGRSPTRMSTCRASGARAVRAASCCPRTGTRSGRRSAASSSASATSTCCASTVAGRPWSSSTPSDELAHLALMRRHAANGDRHAALRQFERMDRALRRELGVAPGREATALRDRLLAEHDVAPRRDDGAGRPRPRSCRSPKARCSTSPPGRAAR